MAISREQLENIINGKAKTLCSLEGMRKIDEVKNKKNNNFYDPTTDFTDFENYDKMCLNESSNDIQDIMYTDEDLKNSKMPNFIKESFSKNTIDMSNSGNLSILDTIGIKGEKTQHQLQQRQIVPENIVNHTNIGSGVDYSIIKAIINECLKEYFDNKQTLNESASLQTIGLQNGNISLVDNKGNIYKAKLEKIGNKNDKK